MKKRWLKIWITSLLLNVGVSFAADKIYTPWNNNLAIKGYDTVAYFIENAPVKGSKQYAYQWEGATWLFKNENNRMLFIDSPNRYAPQFGGYCAFAVANNSTAGIDPTQFTVHEDKLYLNYSKKIQKEWLENRDQFIEDAENNWPTVLIK